jgi:acyl-CoA synthetase (NDP forming)
MARAKQLDPAAAIDGVLIQEQLSGGVEMLAGLSYHPATGTALTIGAGGIYTEIMDDVAVRPLPVDAGDIRDMVAGLKVAKLLAGARGAKPANLDAFVELALKVAQLGESAGSRLAELDLNPGLVTHERAVAVDALAVAG